MYERNAIVLERYFYKIFDFKSSSNLRDNYYNYRKLFECYGNLCDAKEKEKVCHEEYNVLSKEISKLQKNQEKLYNKGAKFEYSRYVIFNNISDSTENIEKHLDKVNEDIQKNIEELRELGQKFVQTVNDYNEKDKNFKDAVSQREKAEEDYNKAYLKARECYEGIIEEKTKLAQEFINSDNKDIKKELQSIFEDNGKNEKNQFDPDVILNTINRSIDIYKNEMDVYLAGFDRISKLFEEIETDSVKIDKHTKYYRDSKAKVDFLNSEKDYIVQFLDNERIGAIYDKKIHRKLMLEACKKFALDFAQIDMLYEIILKEVAGRSTKKIYKENYNKEYLVELENSSIEPSLDTGRMRQEAIAFVNLNYWRVEGMRSIYNAFENIVTTLYDKDLSEFIPEELKQNEENTEETNNIEDNLNEESNGNIEEVVKQETVKHRKVYYSSKISLANAIYYSLQTIEFADSEEKANVDENIYQEDEQYSVPDNVKEILENVQEESKNAQEKPENEQVSVETEDFDDTLEVEESDVQYEFSEESFDLSKLDEIEDDETLIHKENIITEDSNNTQNEEFDEDDEDIDDDEIDIEDEVEEDSILNIYFQENKKEEKENTTETIKKRVGFFQKLVGFNSKEKKKA